jgi:hypothetical protein
MPAATRFRSLGVALLAATVSAVLFAGCALGERPTLVDEPQVEDSVVRTVLDHFDRDPGVFTATYEITPSMTGEPTEAIVIQSERRRGVTIGDVTYVTDGTTTRTCNSDGTDCTAGINEARISNLSITHLFWSDSASAKLKIDASRAVDDSEGRSASIAGQNAWCADVKVPSIAGVGTVTYCVLDTGVLARYFGADVSIELTSYSPDADDAAIPG